jgi:hypothetical protein
MDSQARTVDVTLKVTGHGAIREQDFEFRLNARRWQLESLSLQQWWMPHSTLFQDARHSGLNFRKIVDYFWALCVQDNATTERTPQEVYILANLLPHSRTEGARRILADAFGRRGFKGRHFHVDELNELLERSRLNEKDKVSFRNDTGDLLGRQIFPENIWIQYREMTEKLLSASCAALSSGDTLESQQALDQWKTWMGGLARRRGHEEEKQVLDVISYECRTSFFQCYSATWCELIRHLALQEKWSDAEMRLHMFWHLDQREESAQGPEMDFHLFHGHIIGLHPATGLLVQTAAGARLVADWLCNRQDPAAFRRLLHGLYLAIYQYSEARDQEQQRRRK